MIIETPNALPDSTAQSTAQSTATPVLLTANGTPASLPALNSAPAQKVELRERIHRVAAVAHDAIDKLEQRLGSTGQGLASTQAKGGEQVRQYGSQLRERVTTQPMQSVGIALGAGFVLAKLFGGKPKVQVVRVPEPARARWNDFGTATERRSSGLMGAARSQLERLGDLAQTARDRVAETASQGLEGTQGMGATLARSASALPAQVRGTVDGLLARSQEYGSTARSAIKAHPAAGLGAALGVGALVAVMLARR